MFFVNVFRTDQIHPPRWKAGFTWAWQCDHQRKLGHSGIHLLCHQPPIGYCAERDHIHFIAMASCIALWMLPSNVLQDHPITWIPWPAPSSACPCPLPVLCLSFQSSVSRLQIHNGVIHTAVTPFRLGDLSWVGQPSLGYSVMCGEPIKKIHCFHAYTNDISVVFTVGFKTPQKMGCSNEFVQGLKDNAIYSENGKTCLFQNNKETLLNMRATESHNGVLLLFN